MTWEAVDTILDKAWENNSQALVYFGDQYFQISPTTHEYDIYASLNILCIHKLNQKEEHFIDLDNITRIHLC